MSDSPLDGTFPDILRPGPHTVRVDAAKARLRARLFGRAEQAPKIGRFVVLRQLGAGAMGTVFAAYDERLERKVAVKVLSSPTEGSSRERLLREAKSMARLRHPNIVQVYEVGEHDAEFYIAMEFVDGESLSTWQSEKEHPWKVLVEAYVQAGRGLAAAHTVGVVHRDFKPDNVMVGFDSAGAPEVRVLDFGLARSNPAEQSSVDADGPRPAELLSTVDVSLTRTGKSVGTPAYMAPEQIRGLPAGAASDQFALCVGLWEALHGEHPFAAETIDGLFERVTSGRRGAPRNPTVPRRVTTALERGLELDPEARWPSVEALVEALSASLKPWSSRRTLMLIGVGATFIAVGAASVVSTRDERCAGAHDQLVGIWDDARALELERSMLGTDLSYAETTWARTRAALQTYAADWESMYTEACEATTLRGEQSADVMAQRMRCLHRAKAGLQAATTVFAEADADVLERASEIVTQLDPLQRCADLDALGDDVPPPAAHEEASVAEVEALVARSRAEASAGHYPLAQEIATQASLRAEGLTYVPLLAEVAWARALSYDVSDMRAGHEHDGLEPSLREALRLALTSRKESLAHGAATRLIGLVGGRVGRAEEGLRYREVAEALIRNDPRREALTRGALARVLRKQGKRAEALEELRAAAQLVSDSEPMLRLELQGQIASLLVGLSRADEAEVLLREMLETYDGFLGPDHPSLGALHRRLAFALMWQHRYPEAEAIYREAVESLVRALGRDHANVSMARSELAAVLDQQGKHGETEEQLRLVIELHQRRIIAADPDSAEVFRLIAEGRFADADALDRESRGSHRRSVRVEYRTLGTAYQNLAVALRKRGEFGRAELESRRNREFAKRSGGDTGYLSSIGHRIGYLQSRQGRHAEALAEHRATRAMLERERDPTDPRVLGARAHVADELMQLGKTAEAEAEFRGVLELMESADVSPLERAGVETGLAQVLLSRGDVTGAQPLAESSWGRLEALKPSAFRAGSAFAVAQVRWQVAHGPVHREDARELALQALAYFTPRAEFATEAAEIEAWLDGKREPL
ncbi:MAG: protein kinase domain-containing protein [Nannocystales bacterium]